MHRSRRTPCAHYKEAHPPQFCQHWRGGCRVKRINGPRFGARRDLLMFGRDQHVLAAHGEILECDLFIGEEACNPSSLAKINSE